LCEFAAERLFLSDKAAGAVHKTVLGDGSRDFKSVAAHFRFDCCFKTVVVVDYAVLGDVLNCGFESRSIPFDVEVCHRTFGCEFTADFGELLDVSRKVVRLCVDAHCVDRENGCVRSLVVALALESNGVAVCVRHARES